MPDRERMVTVSGITSVAVGDDKTGGSCPSKYLDAGFTERLSTADGDFGELIPSDACNEDAATAFGDSWTSSDQAERGVLVVAVLRVATVVGSLIVPSRGAAYSSSVKRIIVVTFDDNCNSIKRATLHSCSKKHFAHRRWQIVEIIMTALARHRIQR